MAGTTGSALYLAFDSTVLDTDYRSFSPSEEIGLVDQSAGSDTNRTYLTTLKDGTASATIVIQSEDTTTWGALVPGTEGTLEAPIGFLGREREPYLTLWHSRRPGDATDPPKPYMVERNWSERIAVEPANPYLLEVQDACAAIRGERPPTFGSEPLDATMRVIDACFASDKSGRAIEL